MSSMSGFAYQAGTLHAEGVPLARIAEGVGTPVYIYSATNLAERFEWFRRAVAGLDELICYALKANDTLAVVTLLSSLGAGADVVSAGELAIARTAGVQPQKIVFAGVGKSRAEMEAGLAAGILQFNVDPCPSWRLWMRWGAPWAAGRRLRCASTPMSMPALTPRSPPENRKTNSGSG